MAQAPQCAGSLARSASQPLAAFASQLPKPALHVKPHTPATQVAVAPAGAGHTVHAAPHAVGSVSATHAPAHAWKRGLHVKPHTPPEQAAVPFATTGQAMLQELQLLVLVLGSTQVSPHLSGAAGVQPFVHWKLAPTGAQSGEPIPQLALQAPQLVAFERSVSQPSAATWLQSEYPGSQLVTTHVRPWQPTVLWPDGHGAHVGLPQP